MKRMKKLMAIMLTMTIGIEIGYWIRSAHWAPIIEEKRARSWHWYGIGRFDNEREFIYDVHSQLTVTDIEASFPYLVGLHNAAPIFAIRENKGVFYTIYSLKDGKLCYVPFVFMPYLSSEYLLVQQCIEFPFVTEESQFIIESVMSSTAVSIEVNKSKSILDYVLEKDRPENIFAQFANETVDSQDIGR